MDMSKVDLNAPAFGPGSQSISEEQAAATPEAEAEEVVTPVAPVATTEEEQVAPVEENAVPYSRFKKFHDESKFFQQEAETWKQRAEQLAQSQTPAPQTNVPDWWVKLYGDSPESAEAWGIQNQANEQLKAEAREEAIKALSEQQMNEEQRVDTNLDYIDDNLASLQDTLGRVLTPKEESAVLDIVDDYTPKDDDGNYLGPLIPFDKAWEIYELKTKAIKAPVNQARDSVAALSGAGSQGDSATADKDKEFNPLDWNAWRKKI